MLYIPNLCSVANARSPTYRLSVSCADRFNEIDLSGFACGKANKIDPMRDIMAKVFVFMCSVCKGGDARSIVFACCVKTAVVVSVKFLLHKTLLSKVIAVMRWPLNCFACKKAREKIRIVVST